MSGIKDSRFINADAVRDEDILLDNDNWLRGRNQSNSADINILKVNTDNEIVISDSANAKPVVMGAQLASDPTGVTGGFYYNTTSNEFKFYNGTSWGSMGGGGSGGSTLVVAAAMSNINIASAPSSIEGQSLTVGDLVLLTSQTSAPTNGVYTFNGTGNALTRATGWSATSDFTAGKKVFVIRASNSRSNGNEWTLEETVSNLGVSTIYFVLTGPDTASIPKDLIPYSGNYSLGDSTHPWAVIYGKQHRLINSSNQLLGFWLNGTPTPSGVSVDSSFYTETIPAGGSYSLGFFSSSTSSTSVNTGGLYLESGRATSTTGTNYSGLIQIRTGDNAATGGTNGTGNLILRTGNSVSISGTSSSGSINLQTGTVSGGTRGNINLDARSIDFTNAPLGSNILPDGTGSRSLGNTDLRFLIVSTNAVFLGSGTNNGGRLSNTITSPSGTAIFGIECLQESRTLGVVTADNTLVSSSPSGDLRFETGNKLFGTGNSGDIISTTGTSSGGLRGRVIADARTFRLPKAASAPTATESGEMYFDTTTNKSYTWDGSTWQAHW